MTHLIAFLVLIGVLITVHELGHFIVAKLCGVKVHTFSIGFGRAVLSKQVGETEYRIALLPLGGYVRLHGMEREFGDFPEGGAQGDPDSDDSSADPDAGRALQDKPAWMRVLIFAAGPAMNLLLPFVLLPPLFLSANEYNEVIDNRMGAVDEGLPAYRAGLRDGDRILSINDEEVYAFWQVQRAVNQYTEGDAPLQVQVTRPNLPKPLRVNLTPERVSSTERFSGFTARPMRIGFQPAALASDYIVADLQGPFALAGGESFDRVIQVNDTPIKRHVELIESLGALILESDARSAINTGVPPTITITLQRTTTLDERWQLLKKVEEVKLQLDLTMLRARFREAQAQSRSQPSQPQESHQATAGAPLDTTTLIAQALGVRQASACISSINPESAAHETLEVGDCLLSVDGSTHSLAAFFNQRLRYHPERPKQLTVLRRGETQSVTLALREEVHQDPLAGEMRFWELGFTLSGLSRPGAMLAPQLVENKARADFSWAQTRRRVEGELTSATNSLAGLFSGRVKATQLSGPITIFYLAGQQAEAGWIPFINLMVLISISIALLNLLPIPGLDGGHIFFASFELITRRPLPPKYRVAIQVTGMVMIFLLMLFVLGSDVIRMWRISSGG